MRSNLNVIILKSLMDGDKYGYEIIKEIEEKTDGQLRLKQPSLYSGLNRLEKQKYVSSYWRDSTIGGKRHYYSLTEVGREFFNQNSFNWENSKGLVAGILNSNAALKPNQKEEEFGAFNPETALEGQLQASFSAHSKKYVKPDNKYPEYELNPQKPAAVKIAAGGQANETDNYKTADEGSSDIANAKPSAVSFEENVFAKQQEADVVLDTTTYDIDYKNILGELCESPKTETVTPHFTQSVSAYSPTVLSPKGDPASKADSSKSINSFARELEKIFLNSPDSARLKDAEPIKKDIEELKIKYAKTAAPAKEEHKKELPVINTAELFSNIQIKPYTKIFTADQSNKNFVNINKVRLIKSFAVFLLLLIEIAVIYFCFSAGDLSTPSDGLLSIFAVFVAICYFIISLIILLKDLNKKIKTDYSFKTIWIIRTLCTVVLIALSLLLCIIFGMTDLFERGFLIKWLLPCVLLTNILLAQLIEKLLMRSMRFRA